MERTFKLANEQHLSVLKVPRCSQPITSLEGGGSGTIIFEVKRFAGGESPRDAPGSTRIAGELWLPEATDQPGAERVPAVVYVASKRGYKNEIRERRKKYLNRGWAYMALDSFGGRDVT